MVEPFLFTGVIMNPAKAEVKILTTREIGNNVEDMCEAAEKAVHEYKGAEDGIKQSAKALTTLHAHIDKDIEEGKLDEVVGEPLKVAEYAKKYVTRCMGLLDNLATRAEYQKYKAQGKAEGLRSAVDSIKKVHDAEEIKLKNYVLAVEQAIEDGQSPEEVGRPSPQREPNGRPVDSLAARRAEAKAAKAEKANKAGYTKKRTRKVKDGENT